VWLNEYETLDDACHCIAGYVDRYRHHPQIGLDHRTPLVVRQTREDLQLAALDASFPRGAGQELDQSPRRLFRAPARRFGLLPIRSEDRKGHPLILRTRSPELFIATRRHTLAKP
jgi:hypothetical protein